MGGMHTLVLMEDETLWSFGVNDEGALGRETALDENGDPVKNMDATRPGEVKIPVKGIKQLACTDSASFALIEDGSIYGWGSFRNEHGIFGFSDKVDRQFKPVKIYTPTGFDAPAVKIAAGGNHVVAILNVRSVFVVTNDDCVFRMAGQFHGEMVNKDSLDVSHFAARIVHLSRNARC